MTRERNEPLLTMYEAGHLNEIVQGRVVAPRFLISSNFLQDIGNNRSPFARLNTLPGDELQGRILRIVTTNGWLIYRVTETPNRNAYLAEWVD